MPKVSVCIPVYGVERYIERCARSLFEQTLDDIEFIFVDDCSLDNSVEILKSIIQQFRLRLEEKNFTVKIERMPTNSGQAAVRRHGYKLASGDYVTFCDSDDTMPADAVETLYNLAMKSGADIVSGDMEWLFEDGTRKYYRVSLPYGSNPEAVYQALLHKEYSHTLCSKLFKKDLLQKYDYITLIHATNGEDGMLFYQVLQHATKVVHQNKLVYVYYQNAQSSTHIRLNKQSLYSIIQANKIRLNTCGRIESLKAETWVYVSQVLNGLLAEGYSSVLKQLIANEQMDEFINPKSMYQHYSLKDFINTMVRRILKPLVIKIKL